MKVACLIFALAAPLVAATPIDAPVLVALTDPSQDPDSLVGRTVPLDLSLEKRAVKPAATPADYPTVALNHHNYHRGNHSVRGVAWDSSLASYAADVAATCVFAHNLKPGASTGAYGQNLAVIGSTGNIAPISPNTWVAKAITAQWYNAEEPLFLPSYYGKATPDMKNFERWGHFSQVIWQSTTKVGCASHYCAAGTIFSSMPSWFTVCDYRGQGNVGSQYAKNVLRPRGRSTITA